MIDRQLHSNWGLAKKYELPHADNGTSTGRNKYQRRKYKTPMGLQRPNRQGDTSKKTRHRSHKEGEEMSYHRRMTKLQKSNDLAWVLKRDMEGEEKGNSNIDRSLGNNNNSFRADLGNDVSF